MGVEETAVPYVARTTSQESLSFHRSVRGNIIYGLVFLVMYILCFVVMRWLLNKRLFLRRAFMIHRRQQWGRSRSSFKPSTTQRRHTNGSTSASTLFHSLGSLRSRANSGPPISRPMSPLAQNNWSNNIRAAPSPPKIRQRRPRLRRFGSNPEISPERNPFITNVAIHRTSTSDTTRRDAVDAVEGDNRTFDGPYDNVEDVGGEEDEDNADMIQSLPFYLCAFGFTFAWAALVMTPMTMVVFKIMERFDTPNNIYLMWLDEDLIVGFWNIIFVGANVVLFIVLPFAFFYHESEEPWLRFTTTTAVGDAVLRNGRVGEEDDLGQGTDDLPEEEEDVTHRGQKVQTTRSFRSRNTAPSGRRTWGRLQESFVLVSLLALLVAGFIYLVQAILDIHIKGLNTWVTLNACLCATMSLVSLYSVPKGVSVLFILIKSIAQTPNYRHRVQTTLQMLECEENVLMGRIESLLHQWRSKGGHMHPQSSHMGPSPPSSPTVSEEISIDTPTGLFHRLRHLTPKKAAQTARRAFMTSSQWIVPRRRLSTSSVIHQSNASDASDVGARNVRSSSSIRYASVPPSLLQRSGSLSSSSSASTFSSTSRQDSTEDMVSRGAMEMPDDLRDIQRDLSHTRSQLNCLRTEKQRLSLELKKASPLLRNLAFVLLIVMNLALLFLLVVKLLYSTGKSLFQIWLTLPMSISWLLPNGHSDEEDMHSNHDDGYDYQSTHSTSTMYRQHDTSLPVHEQNVVAQFIAQTQRMIHFFGFLLELLVILYFTVVHVLGFYYMPLMRSLSPLIAFGKSDVLLASEEGHYQPDSSRNNTNTIHSHNNKHTRRTATNASTRSYPFVASSLFTTHLPPSVLYPHHLILHCMALLCLASSLPILLRLLDLTSSGSQLDLLGGYNEFRFLRQYPRMTFCLKLGLLFNMGYRVLYTLQTFLVGLTRDLFE